MTLVNFKTVGLKILSEGKRSMHLSWVGMPFGKYKAKALPFVLLSEPDWLYANFTRGEFDNTPVLRNQVGDLMHLASAIKLPKETASTSVVEYQFSPTNRRFVGFRIIDISAMKTGQFGFCYKKQVDIFLPKDINSEDALSGKQATNCFRQLFLGAVHAPLTEQFAIEFFSESQNFLVNASTRKRVA